MDDNFDNIQIGEKKFPVATGYDNWGGLLKSQFPGLHL